MVASERGGVGPGSILRGDGLAGKGNDRAGSGAIGRRTEEDSGMNDQDTPDRPAGGASYLLTINGGSSSLKFALFTRGNAPARVAAGKIERIGQAGTRLVVADASGGGREDRPV